MERSRYSIKPNAGKGLSGFITNFSVAGEFDPAWLDSNTWTFRPQNLTPSASNPAWLDSRITSCAKRVAHSQSVSDR